MAVELDANNNGKIDDELLPVGSLLTGTDTIETRLAGDAHRLANLRKLDGSALANPFTVAQAGGADSWCVLLPTARPVDAYHVEGAAYLADISRLRPATVLHFSAEPASPPEAWMYDVRVFGAITSPVTATIQPDGSIQFTFSEAVTGVTCNGNGTGTLEATDGTSYAPSVSGSGAIYTLAPPVAGWIEAATITLTGKTTIAAVADATKLYDGLGFLLTVAETSPDVTAPVMTGFVVEATSADANIAITALSATDDRGVTGYQVNTSATAPNPATGTWQSAAAWIAAGYASGLTAGQTQTVTLYAWAKDAAGNVSLSLTDSCDVSIPAHAPSFSVQPVLNAALYDGGTFNFTVADDSGHNLDIQKWNGTAWSAALTNVAAGAKVAVPITGLTAGTKSGLKFRVADTGTTAWSESSVIANFNTVAPTLSSVVAGDTQNTITFANHANDTADSFNILWGTSTGVLTNTIVGATSPRIHSGLTNGQAYYYAVVAIKGGITSSQSTELSGTPTAGVTSLVNATFTAADDTAFTAYTPEVGGIGTSWVGTQKISGNALVANTFASYLGSNHSLGGWDVGEANVYIKATFAVNTVGESIVFRRTDNPNLLFFWRDGASLFSLYKVVTGTANTVNATSTTGTVSGSIVEIMAFGDTIKIRVGGQTKTWTGFTIQQTGTGHGLLVQTSYPHSLLDIEIKTSDGTEIP